MTLPVLDPADIDYATRAIMALPKPHWDAAALIMLKSAQLAARLHREGHRAHPVLGNGSVSSVVSRWPKVRSSDVHSVHQAEALAVLSRVAVLLNRPSE